MDNFEEYLNSIGCEKSGLDKLVQEGYNLLGLITFFTIGPKEAHAWTFASGSLAPAAAGIIHTDFEKRFIRAEVIFWKDLLESGSFSAARSKGLLRTEGKEYIVKDGDVMEFKV